MHGVLSACRPPPSSPNEFPISIKESSLRCMSFIIINSFNPHGTSSLGKLQSKSIHSNRLVSREEEDVSGKHTEQRGR